MNNIGHLRTQAGLSQKELAAEAGMQLNALINWEDGMEPRTIKSILGLCQALDCSTDTLLGLPPSNYARAKQRAYRMNKQNLDWCYPDRLSLFDVIELRDTALTQDDLCPDFGKPDHHMPFGTLEVQTTGGKRRYPVSERARGSLLDGLEHSYYLDKPSVDWIYTWTQNNRVVFINKRHLLDVRLINDCVEEMPMYASPEVYSALHHESDDKPDNHLEKACDAYSNTVGDSLVEQEADDTSIVYANGHIQSMTVMSGYDIHQLNTMIGSDHMVDASFWQVSSEDGYVDHGANMDAIAILELPRDHLLQQLGQGEWFKAAPVG